MCLRVRNGAFDAIKSAAALRLSPCLCVLHCSDKQQDLCNHPTAEFSKRRLFNECYEPSAPGAVQSSPAEAVQKGAPAKAQQSGFGGERRSSGTTELLPLKAKRRMWSLRRRDGPKSRKLHQCEFVGRPHVSPPNPRIKARFQRAALEPFGLSFFHIFLQTKKDMATGGRTEKRMPVKT